jgi:hypothetical protein
VLYYALFYNFIATIKYNLNTSLFYNFTTAINYNLNTMATPAERLADSLDELRKLQVDGKVAIQSDELSRTHRERLVANGFLKEVVKGWYIISRPDERPGDTTSWYSNFWHFCSRFLNEKHKENWCISAEQSMQIHAGNWSVPTQLIIKSPEANNFKTELLYETSLFSMRSELPVLKETTIVEGVRMLTLPASLIHCSPGTFTQNITDIRTALSLISDPSELLADLLDGGHTTIAGRLVGAFRNNGQDKIANDILQTMKSAGFDIRETDPFDSKLSIKLSSRQRSPYVNRIKLMWGEMREAVIKAFPKAPGLPSDITDYMQKVEEIYLTDAYHSLSIEKYIVTPELIERVRIGTWNFHENEEDRRQRDAMAARGYWQAFQRVEKSIEKILQGENPGQVADADYGTWYRELFAPSVTAGILKPSDLAGFRNQQVYIAGSKHVPLNNDAVREAMPTLFELLELEPEASVRAVLGHFIFVFIHPYMDGNGRMGRFLMNAMLASGGYPWTVIPVEQRDAYMVALEKASVEQNIESFANFIGYLVYESLQGKPIATITAIEPEFPPYKFYKRKKEQKLETWAVPVDEKFSLLRLFDLHLIPMEVRQKLLLEIIVNTRDQTDTYNYELSDLFYNPKLTDNLFFIEHGREYVEIILPSGKKNVTFRINELKDSEEFELSLNCRYY